MQALEAEQAWISLLHENHQPPLRALLSHRQYGVQPAKLLSSLALWVVAPALIVAVPPAPVSLAKPESRCPKP